MDTLLKLVYTGKKQLNREQKVDENGHPIAIIPYVADEPLIDAVNIAIELERPLLIKGEPGCGKTRLAKAVADELDLPYKEYHVKSTSRAQDVLYTYDTVGRLRDAQLAIANHLTEEDIARIQDPETYITWEPLGEAFRNNKRTVVLIDEIDKADIDFPNDLLQELDKGFFIVKEIGSREIRAEHPPIVFITSNDERDLSDAFLRRCLFYNIEFPDKQRLIEILRAHFPGDHLSDIIQTAVQRFMELRDQMSNDREITRKNVSTSELIDWFRILDIRNPHPRDFQKKLEGKGKLPYLSVLLKSGDDLNSYLKKTKDNH